MNLAYGLERPSVIWYDLDGDGTPIPMNWRLLAR